ncbi:hypothetical protein BAE44_0023664 [Dichanthelium oligosanthes]|uniref:Glucose-6-phosphate 1-epimerase n=1 Tax=Dichanthelium oligosanthes TaxID=888268 RepID=A0A1E5UR23_9POAL|nr:hypothetical protein BAE44_0023664 [Dichanthelium oligosanthes]
MAASCASTLPSLSFVSSFSSNSPRRFRRSGVVAMASIGQKVYAPGVALSEGNGGLPKIDLKSPHGRCCVQWAETHQVGLKPYAIEQKLFAQWHANYLLFLKAVVEFHIVSPSLAQVPCSRFVKPVFCYSEVTDGDPAVTLELKDDSYSRSMWDFSFQALYKVSLHSTSLSTTLKIINMDDKPFSFNTALHTYFCVSCIGVHTFGLQASITGVSVKGLKGCKTLNKDPDPKNPLEGKEERSWILALDTPFGAVSMVCDAEHKFLSYSIPYREEVTFPGFVDCIYLGAPSELILDNGLGDKIAISNSNWSDAVLWNPHLQMEACYKDFVCVENAKIETIQLEPKQSWVAEQKIELV